MQEEQNQKIIVNDQHPCKTKTYMDLLCFLAQFPKTYTYTYTV